MDAQPPIEWRLHLRSSPEMAFAAWASNSGRERFWAERSQPAKGGFTLTFINGQVLGVEILESDPANRLVFRYFGGSIVTLSFGPDGKGGCDLHLREQDPEAGNLAGWVSVLLGFKAAIDFGVDLRAHDPERTWEAGYVDC